MATGSLAPEKLLGRAGTDRQRGEAGRATEAFLGAAVDNVGAPGIDGHRYAAQRGDTVHHQQAAVAVDDLRHPLHRLPGAGRGLGVDQRHQLGRLCFQGRLDLGELEHVAPRPFQPSHPGAIAGGHVAQPLAEIAVHPDQHRVVRLDEIAQRGFHARAAGPRHRDGEPVLGLQDETQQLLHLVHHGDKLGVQVAQQRVRHRAQHARMHGARSRAQQDARGGIEVQV